MMTPEQEVKAEELYKANPKISREAVAEGIGLGTGNRSVRDWLRLRKGPSKSLVVGITMTRPVISVQVKGKTLDEFRQQYDKSYIIPTRVKDALKAMGNTWEYEGPFAKQACVTLADLGDVREQFIDHVVILSRDGRRAWAGTAATAEAMRKMI